ncbi:TonB-dependent receptor [Caulobacter sp. UNC279MFTsu5.1]|uniref:TonB-dependent receptor n=1 Tax=Caulobacter sp. UNC279MFTsu5.1 TaxID=1502775 RepID=UPI002100ECD1|nr:TonB-dependent receptor [Caulobacter sp. UNC279MFTsu5.1]
MLVAAPAWAQTKPADEVSTVDEVVVTSIRQSLKSSQQLKQSSEIIGDSITAEDIGALPDRSVTEALQRIPGVAINRFAAGVDPDHFSTEGSGVVVRGLNFVRSELNGRDTFSANNGRALSFADVPSELMGGVDVFKSPSADMIEGGISGTVNLRTRLPFDSTKRLLSVSAEASYGDFVKRWAPTYTALYSDQWDTEAGTFGLLLSAVDSKLFTRADGTQVSNFGCRTGFTSAQTANPQAVDCPQGGKGVWFPRGAAFRSTETERERTGYAAAGQWRSNDDTMLATFQYLRSESTQSWTEHAMEIATDNVTSNGDSRPIDGTTFGVDSDGIFTNGIITGTTGWRDDQNGPDPRTPTFGLQSNNISRSVEQTYVTSDYGFNFKWTPNDRLGVAFDYQHVDSTVDNLDVGIWGSSFQNLDLKLNGSDMPVFTFIPPASGASIPACSPPSGSCSTYFTGAHNSFQDPYNSFWRSAMDHIEQSEGKEDAAKIDVDYRFAENSWLDSARVGVRWAERDQTTRFSTYNWGVLSEIWGAGGPVWFDDPINGNPATPGGSTSSAHTELYPFTDFMRGQVPVPTGLDARPFYNGNAAKDYAAMSAFALSVGDEWRARNGANGCAQNWVPLAQRCNVIAGTPFLPQEINPVNETTKSAYGMLRFKHDAGNDVRITGNIGLRYTETTREASGFRTFPLTNFSTDAECASVPAGQTPTPFCQLTPAIRAQARLWANGAVVPDTAHAKFEYWLPSFNLKVAMQHGVQLRFGLSKTLTPPEIGLTRNYYNLALNTNADGISNGMPTGNVTVGNPFLKPTQAKNIDASVEWYFAPVGSLTFAAFWKELTDVATNTTARVPFTNNGATFDVLVTTPGNAEQKAHVKGFEVAYQQFYDFLPKPLDGFGINANYSYIDSKGVPQSTLSATDPDVAAGRVSTVNTALLPLQGLSKHNANLAAIYEKGPISARLAYNWRSDFLLTVRDVIVPFAPIMNEATGQLDGSLFYTLNPKVKIGVQGVNLTNEVTKTTQVLNDQLLKAGRSWFMNDRRYTFVVRASF